jgi:UDP-N-acetylglucosamine 2-epimerase (non-hydrolysing)
MAFSLSYVAFMSLVSCAAVTVTDSGGIQGETTCLGIPCFTLRDTTERPLTVEQGTNRLATAATLPTLLERALRTRGSTTRRPRYWNDRTAGRCVEDLRRRSSAGTSQSVRTPPERQISIP